MKDRILKEFHEFGIAISESQAQQYHEYYKLLIESNAKFNLTAITEFEEVLIKHFIDSASIVNIYPDSLQNSLIDIGSGGGFPGMVLAILLPETKVSLLETSSKKATFLSSTSEALKLKNVEVICERAEIAAKRDEYREKYDTAVSRAVASLNVLMEYMLPFVNEGGSAIAYKGGDVSAEIAEGEKALITLGGDTFVSKSLSLPLSYGNRTFVSCKKINPTPPEYPRRAGIPTKRPL